MLSDNGLLDSFKIGVERIATCSPCGICGAAGHDAPKHGVHEGKQCFMLLHIDDCNGLARCDSSVRGMQKRQWSEPSPGPGGISAEPCM